MPKRLYTPEGIVFSSLWTGVEKRYATGEPFVIWRISNPDGSPEITNRLKIKEVRPTGTSLVYIIAKVRPLAEINTPIPI